MREFCVPSRIAADADFFAQTPYRDPPFAARGAQTIARASLAAQDGARKAWEDLKAEIRDMSLAETHRKKYIESQELKNKRRRLQIMRADITRGDSSLIATADRLQKEIGTAARAARTLHDTLEVEAYNTGKKHDVCSREFFRQWDPSSISQAPQCAKEADWTNPSNPTFTGKVADTVQGVLQTFTDCFTAIYSRKQISPQAKETCLRLLRDGNRVLPPTAKACGAPIDKDELEKVLNNLPTGKSAGPDVVPNAFYKIFAASLKDLLTDVLNESRTEGALPASCLEGLISVLYKKKDREDPRNYRPITLLNNDYKILMRILAQRMNTAVLQFVSSCQSGFVPGAFIAENLQLLKLIQAYIDEEDEEAIFVFLDMEKAFDRCSWEFMIEALTAIGFDEDFVAYIKLCYSHETPPTRKFNINGHLGPSFPLASGVAQGCPISALLFLIITEPLSRLIESDQRIKGVNINGRTHKLSQYADDSPHSSRTPATSPQDPEASPHPSKMTSTPGAKPQA